MPCTATVEDCYQTTGRLLENVCDDSVILVDAFLDDCPIVGVSGGFTKLTGYTIDDVLGKNCRLMLDGVPKLAISRSSRQNITNFCAMCCVPDLQGIPEITACVANTRRNGTHYVNFFMMGVCFVGGRRLIVSVQRCMAEGLIVQMSQAESARVAEASLVALKRVRNHLGATRHPPPCAGGHPGACRSLEENPEMGFYAERLQDHCVLTNRGLTAFRREAAQVGFGSMCYGGRPARRTAQGVSFTVRIDAITPTFSGLPLLGFTRRRPRDAPDLYPMSCRALGQSVLIGACGEAFARDKLEHFKIGFKQPPKTEVEFWCCDPDLPLHKRAPPVELKRADVVQCTYCSDGRIQLYLNQNLCLDFATGRPLEDDADYYPVIDICLSVIGVTLLPTQGNTGVASDTGSAATASDMRPSPEILPKVCAPAKVDAPSDEVVAPAPSAISESQPCAKARASYQLATDIRVYACVSALGLLALLWRQHGRRNTR